MFKGFIIWDELNKSEAYLLSGKLVKVLWGDICNWDYFENKTIGIQFIRSADSVHANLAEGFGRYFYKEKLRFYFYARGSLVEAATWFDLAQERGLLKKETIQIADDLFARLPFEINKLIKNIRSQF